MNDLILFAAVIPFAGGYVCAWLMLRALRKAAKAYRDEARQERLAAQAWREAASEYRDAAKRYMESGKATHTEALDAIARAQEFH